MFTGLIETRGTVRRREAADGGLRLTLEPEHPLAGLGIGESIAVSGVCLTAEPGSTPDQLSFFLSAETCQRSTLGGLATGWSVNLERALRADDRLGGHMVLGHVDAVGTIRRYERQGEAWTLEVAAPPRLAPYLAPKGSIAVDGISLTMVESGADWFTVAVIPHTAAVTTLQRAATGTDVNLEVDVLSRYVVRALAAMRNHPGGVDLDLLARAGFMGD